MATCPRCFQEKPFLADKCPHCTADVPIGRQTEFSISAGFGAIAGFLFVLWVVSLIFG